MNSNMMNGTSGNNRVACRPGCAKRDVAIRTIEFVKGEDRSAPIVMAVTVETL